MTELLAKIIEFHGGLERWKNFSRVEATIVTGGALWGMKNLRQDQEPRCMTVWPPGGLLHPRFGSNCSNGSRTVPGPPAR